MVNFKTEIIFGYCELKEIVKFENGKMVTYGYRIDYDRDGNETGRTEPTFLTAMGWSNGSFFIEKDLRELKESSSWLD